MFERLCSSTGAHCDPSRTSSRRYKTASTGGAVALRLAVAEGPLLDVSAVLVPTSPGVRVVRELECAAGDAEAVTVRERPRLRVALASAIVAVTTLPLALPLRDGAAVGVGFSVCVDRAVTVALTRADAVPPLALLLRADAVRSTVAVGSVRVADHDALT
jgi:hypothetical protein